jgi:hypothetical protein
MNKIREINLDRDGLYFVVKTKEGLWAFVDVEDREVVLGSSPEDAIARFYSSISSDVISPSDVRINVLDSNKAIVCVKDDCWECSVELE